MVQVFLRVVKFFPVNITQPTPHTHLHLHVAVTRKIKWLKPVEPSKMHAVLEIREHCTEKHSHIFKSVYKGFMLSDQGL